MDDDGLVGMKRKTEDVLQDIGHIGKVNKNRRIWS